MYIRLPVSFNHFQSSFFCSYCPFNQLHLASLSFIPLQIFYRLASKSLLLWLTMFSNKHFLLIKLPSQCFSFSSVFIWLFLIFIIFMQEQYFTYITIIVNYIIHMQTKVWFSNFHTQHLLHQHFIIFLFSKWEKYLPSIFVFFLNISHTHTWEQGYELKHVWTCMCWSSISHVWIIVMDDPHHSLWSTYPKRVVHEKSWVFEIVCPSCFLWIEQVWTT